VPLKLPTSRPSPPGREVPRPVLRQWSDALAAAGLFAEALQIHPALERADIVRRAELSVLAGDPEMALHLLGELAAATTPRTQHATRTESTRPGPWLRLLTSCAELLAGRPVQLDAVLTAASRVEPSAGVDWVVALAAATAGNLPQATIAAESARAGGCRDLRMLAVVAASRAAEHDDQAALALVGMALRVALPDEDPAGYVVDLLARAGFRADARRLAATGAGDSTQPGPVRAAWRRSARRVGAGHKGALRRSLTAAGSMAVWPRQHQERRIVNQALQDLTCHCYGSAGWIGESRMYYVTRHLVEILPAPVAGLPARLLRCRATALTFLDFVERQFTLPVISEVLPVEAGEQADDSEGHPTPGMGVSLGESLTRGGA
jgi:hypothetical protein